MKSKEEKGARENKGEIEASAKKSATPKID